MKKITTIAFCAATMMAAQMAHANSFTISGSVGGAPTGVKYVNFDNLTAGQTGGLTGTGSNGSVGLTVTTDGQVAVGSVSSQYAAPFLSGGNGTGFGNANGIDTTPYLTTGKFPTPGGSVEMDFGGDQKYLGLLWGSVDSYNTLEFFDASHVSLGTVTGSQVTASPNGDQGVSGTLYVNINTTDAFRYVKATSSSYAFEFDNVAYNDTNVSVPDGGSTCALLGLGLVGVGALRRKLNRA